MRGGSRILEDWGHAERAAGPLDHASVVQASPLLQPGTHATVVRARPAMVQAEAVRAIAANRGGTRWDAVGRVGGGVNLRARDVGVAVRV